LLIKAYGTCFILKIPSFWIQDGVLIHNSITARRIRSDGLRINVNTLFIHIGSFNSLFLAVSQVDHSIGLTSGFYCKAL
jgi:hypothetical protein